MTDIQDQLVLPDAAPESRTAAAAAASSTAAKRRGAGLSTMLLPELQSLASSMGIAPGKLRKGDLVAAIQDRQAPAAQSAPAAAPVMDTPARETPASEASASEASAPDAAERPQRTRRGASRAAGAPAQAELPTGEARTSEARASEVQSAPESAGPISAAQDNAAHNGTGQTATSQRPPSSYSDNDDRPSRTDRGDRPDRASRNARQAERQSDGSATRQNEGQAPRSDRPDRSERPDRTDRTDRTDRFERPDRADRTNGQDRQDRPDRGNSPDRAERPDRQAAAQNGASQNGQSAGAAANGPLGAQGNQYDDDEDGGRRRGRRYRDRRGRTRERGPSTGLERTPSNSDMESTISDDDVVVPVSGILDAIEDKNMWFIRTGGYVAGPDDVFVATSYIRRYDLRRGDAVTGGIKAPRDGDRREKYNPLVRLDTVNGQDPELARNRPEFTRLTPLYPNERLRLETEPHILTTRVIDLIMPIGKGQRALIVSPPKAGKTSVLQAIANAIATNNPECHLMVVLVDERPEEVTDMQRSVRGEVIASTFDRRPQEHTQIAELSIERAKRLVEMGHDVVVLLDSITRLGRAYNLAAPASGRILSGGVDSTALYPPKRFLGAARNIENGGSLTIIATALVETGSTMDTVIFEEFKGTGNAELKLDRKIADKRVFPAVDIDPSGTRKEEVLLAPDELAVLIKLRRVLHALDAQSAIDLLMDKLKKSKSNLEFLLQIAKTTPGTDNDR